MSKVEKQIHKIEDLLSYQEILNIGLPEPLIYSSMSLEDLVLLGSDDKHRGLILEVIYNKINEDFEKEFPDCPGVLKRVDATPVKISLPESYIWFKSKKIGPYKNTLKLDVINYFNEILIDKTFRFLMTNDSSFFDYEKVAEASSIEEQKELIKGYLRKKRDLIKENRDFKGYSLVDVDTSIDEVYRHVVKYLNWNIRNIDRLFEYFEKPIDLSILECIDKDKFLAFYVFRSLHIIDWDKFENSSKYKLENSVEIVENYFLLLDFLKSITKHNYKVSFETLIKYSDGDNEGKIVNVEVNLDDIKQELEMIYEKYPCLKSRENRVTSYEELLSTRASETWKKIQQKEAVKRIKGYWELIPKGESLTTTVKTLTRPSVLKSNQEKSLKLKEAYQLLDDKMEFFDLTNPVCELSGINTFDGYKAYIYPNSCVILEKFYTYDSNQKLVPTVGEAIYVMNLFEFIGLSRLTKPEIIEEINSYNNPNVYRIYHSKNWKKKVEKAITGNGYGYSDECLDYIEALAKDLSKSSGKVKTME